MNILGIIPARYASTRFPGKPLVDIFGKPMIQHVFEKSSEVLEYVAVATDDNRIAEAVRAFGGRVVMTSENHQSGTDRCAEALLAYEKSSGLHFDAVINIQGDEPFIDPAQIRSVAEMFADKATQLGTLIKPVDSVDVLLNENKPKVVVSLDGHALYFSRHAIPFYKNVAPKEWLTKHKYFQHIGLYGYSRKALMEITQLPKSSLESAESLEQLRWLENGYRIKTALTFDEGLSVDTPEDLEIVLKKFRK